MDRFHQIAKTVRGKLLIGRGDLDTLVLVDGRRALLNIRKSRRASSSTSEHEDQRW